MVEVTARVRKWGSSLATVIPPDALRAEGIQEGDEVVITVRRALRPEDVFGMLRGTDLDPQAMKDEIRREEAAAERRKWGTRGSA